MAIFTRTDKRFRRARLKPARKRRHLGRLLGSLWTLLVFAAMVYGCYRAAAVVVNAPVFQVDRVVVSGNQRLSTGEVLAVLQGLQGSSILRADLGIWRRRLMGSPWVRDVAMRRVLPSTVEVVLAERRPIGLGRFGGRLYLVDAEGTIIDEFGPQYRDLDLPIIDGLAPATDAGPPRVEADRAQLAARLLASLAGRPDLAGRVSQIDVSDPHDAVVLLDGDATSIHVGEERFGERLGSYLELAPVLRERVPDIDYVDLRFGERIYVRPALPGSPLRSLTAGSDGSGGRRF